MGKESIIDKPAIKTAIFSAIGFRFSKQEIMDTFGYKDKGEFYLADEETAYPIEEDPAWLGDFADSLAEAFDCKVYYTIQGMLDDFSIIFAVDLIPVLGTGKQMGNVWVGEDYYLFHALMQSDKYTDLGTRLSKAGLITQPPIITVCFDENGKGPDHDKATESIEEEQDTDLESVVEEGDP